MATFNDLVAEGAAVPVEGWDFSWFAGRATEARPSWGYARLLGEHLAQARAALDIDTGGGEVVATAPTPPPVLVATESWPPNVPVARAHLAPLGGTVVETAPDAPLPFADNTFDLVTSRHPVRADWPEIARVLAPGGTYLSQQVGRASVHELTEWFLGPTPVGSGRDPEVAVAAAYAAGLRVRRLLVESLPMTFDDVAAVIVFLRKVPWIVPGFTPADHLDRLRGLHAEITAHGPFRATSARFLVEATKPGQRSGS
ncbi:MAG TPA: class I SAM-dependent methyltransferase [Actinocatenispora sp.]